MAQTGLERHRAALGKTREHNAIGIDAARFFLRNQLFYRRLRLAQSRFILTPRKVEAEYVIPCAHHVAVIDRYRHRWRMRKYEADRRAAAQIEFAHDRHEVIAIRAQAMQPDH